MRMMARKRYCNFGYHEEFVEQEQVGLNLTQQNPIIQPHRIID